MLSLLIRRANTLGTNSLLVTDVATQSQSLLSKFAATNAISRGYHENIVEHYENPRNVGSFDKNDNSVGTVSYPDLFMLLTNRMHHFYYYLILITFSYS